MKKILLGLLAFMLVTPVVAAQNNGTGAQMGSGSQQAGSTSVVVTPMGNKVENKVQTQNQGEESQLQVQTEEKLGTEATTTMMGTRSEKAMENMSEVAKQVQGMLEIRTTGGIGDQVRVVAKEQNQAQEKIQEHVMKMETKNVMLKKLFGPDVKSLASLTELIAENTVRIEQLQTLLMQVQNYTDRTQIEATIQSIISQNTALNNLIQEENQTRSMFGWLIRLFNQ